MAPKTFLMMTLNNNVPNLALRTVSNVLKKNNKKTHSEEM